MDLNQADVGAVGWVGSGAVCTPEIEERKWLSTGCRAGEERATFHEQSVAFGKKDQF